MAGHRTTTILPMRAMVIPRYGGPEALELRDVPKPEPKSGEVLVKVAAAGVNFADTMQARGTYPGGPKPPFITGFEFAGTIEPSGERVMGLAKEGACAEFVTTPRIALFPLPDGWSFAEGAAFP